MVAWARKYGIQSTIHTGGPSVPGSGYIDADVVLEADADVIGHINGGHTALPLQADRVPVRALRPRDRDRAQRQRVRRPARGARSRASSDSSTASSSAPTARPGRASSRSASCGMIAMLSSFGDMPAETVFCFATGNTARIRDLDCGLIEAGPRRRFRVHGQGAAFGRQGSAGERARRRPARHRHGGDRRRRALPALAQHPAGGPRPGDRALIKIRSPASRVASGQGGIQWFEQSHF